MTEATSPLATNDYLREQLVLMETRLREQHSDLRAELHRAFSIQTLVIVGTMTAIMAALTQI